MMDWTDRHCRYFHRLLAPDVRLYTEMITARALLAGDADRLLAFDPSEHPVAVQLGGSDPQELARASAMAAAAGYDEINLNVGCPSPRVSAADFGACLMKEPGLVREALAAMRSAVSVPVTVKHRIGVDELDNYDFMAGFVATLSEAGIGTFIVHARKALLKGLSPKENRTIPPLMYDRVYRLKRDFPKLLIVINGGIGSLAEVREHLAHVDGVMLGRRAYEDPWLLTVLQAEILDPELGREPAAPTREAVVERMAEYVACQAGQGVRLRQVTRHMLGLCHGLPGARAWRRWLSEPARDRGPARETLLAAPLPRAVGYSGAPSPAGAGSDGILREEETQAEAG
ncbi:MAG: tRNA dihydrouridine(20/20a) synthase DusA [Chromatiales bacterium]|nr:tRNA dihydrouridine(20/20a) synthase DusA [Chromatiales bacterium]